MGGFLGVTRLWTIELEVIFKHPILRKTNPGLRHQGSGISVFGEPGLQERGIKFSD